PWQRTEHDLLDARLRRSRERHRVAVTAESRVDPEDVDREVPRIGLRPVRIGLGDHGTLPPPPGGSRAVCIRLENAPRTVSAMRPVSAPKARDTGSFEPLVLGVRTAKERRTRSRCPRQSSSRRLRLPTRLFPG